VEGVRHPASSWSNKTAHPPQATCRPQARTSGRFRRRYSVCRARPTVGHLLSPEAAPATCPLIAFSDLPCLPPPPQPLNPTLIQLQEGRRTAVVSPLWARLSRPPTLWRSFMTRCTTLRGPFPTSLHPLPTVRRQLPMLRAPTQQQLLKLPPSTKLLTAVVTPTPTLLFTLEWR